MTDEWVKMGKLKDIIKEGNIKQSNLDMIKFGMDAYGKDNYSSYFVYGSPSSSKEPLMQNVTIGYKMATKSYDCTPTIIVGRFRHKIRRFGKTKHFYKDVTCSQFTAMFNKQIKEYTYWNDVYPKKDRIPGPVKNDWKKNKRKYGYCTTNNW